MLHNLGALISPSEHNFCFLRDCFCCCCCCCLMFPTAKLICILQEVRSTFLAYCNNLERFCLRKLPAIVNYQNCLLITQFRMKLKQCPEERKLIIRPKSKPGGKSHCTITKERNNVPFHLYTLNQLPCAG